MTGQIVYVSPVLNSNNRFLVRAEVPNRQVGGNWILMDGQNAKMTIHVGDVAVPRREPKTVILGSRVKGRESRARESSDIRSGPRPLDPRPSTCSPMATLADSLVSSSSRKLPIRMRPDLAARQQRYQGRIYWVVKDPVGLQYFRFEEEEFAILQMLDGESSLDEIAERFEREFPPQTIRIEELQQFIGMLHRSGLVITDAAGQGQQLVKRRDERNMQAAAGDADQHSLASLQGHRPRAVLQLALSVHPLVLHACRRWCAAFCSRSRR